MTETPKSDRSSRLILIGLLVLAAVTIAGTILATMGEWNYAEPAAVSEPADGNGDEATPDSEGN